MILVADSYGKSTEWVLTRDGIVVERGVTAGIDPTFQTRKDISRIIRLELSETFFKRHWRKVVFYCPGCITEERRSNLETSIMAQFHTDVWIFSDIDAAGRSQFQHDEGIICVMTTHCASGFYNGKRVERPRYAGGFYLLEEGSFAYLAKRFASDLLLGAVPQELEEEFCDIYDLTPKTMLEELYTKPRPDLQLLRNIDFIKKRVEHPYMRNIVYSGFLRFFQRHMPFYDIDNYPVSVTGPLAGYFPDILRKADKDFGVNIRQINFNSIDGLVQYHQNDR